MAAVTTPLRERIAALHARIQRAGRSPSEVRVVAVTKGFGSDVTRAALAEGLVDLGENYAQELLAKAAAAPLARWHFLGPVQRNKVKALAPHVALWHAVDRDSAAGEIDLRRPSAQMLVQVNLSGDPARPGASWEEAPRLVERLRGRGLGVCGLMGVASQDAPRPQFRRLARLAAALELRELSMGMSGDLDVALEEGSTIVRVGTALFGARPGATQVRR